MVRGGLFGRRASGVAWTLAVLFLGLVGCKKEQFVPPLAPLPAGAQVDPYVPTDMDWRIMLRYRTIETPYGSFTVEMHRLVDIKVSSQTAPDPSNVVTSLVATRYRMEDGSYLSILFELKWTVDGVTWDVAANDQKFVASSNYHLQSLRVVSANPAS